eukprot:Plantae.Rhodophyta-Purpureofilum_apyrenoidigerum.ctg6890.p1 GENE.Plantae.Rhodophyta-Purpureofilum_apyrenoidigerum.ctg6890~~Plantae.Rhodophyta-Purpureofilum_apyrenoidigerum.ctg6890.p1  ORF type:complete len:679 (+),score=115.02 Plantae.Rhodophyta-Purpureofilum_apyrenoidigerum.ctg6890:186-2222(+)
MGIPKFYRWLSDRYPLINQRLDETHEFDNFYLDMNGIIHQCTHPNDDEVVVNDLDEMFRAIFKYTDRLYRIVRPQKLLYLAVDGVAPRAKMNQQRSRRFRSAKDNERTLAEAIAKGIEVPTDKPFDSNCITPGTQFMQELSRKFKSWIHYKMSTDSAWQQGCEVIFSGSEVPGEGEHKIMDYIRDWRASDAWEPTRRHCMYGLDADLIMLGLVTHEPHFTLLRERIRWRGGRRRVPIMKGDMSDAEEFELLEISLLRDMLYLEFRPQGMRAQPRRNLGVQPVKSTVEKLSFKYEAMRVVDDFVFMCMLVGNDFVPHIPHLDIAEGALNLMFRSYKELLPTWGGYLTDLHRLHPDRLERFFETISEAEEHFFSQRSLEEEEPLYDGPSYAEYYYKKKLNIDNNDTEALNELVLNFVEGLHWVLQYYHNGCPSWNWYYKYFYAPLASDMRNLKSYRVRFKKGKPFRPLTQLLAVLPPDSADFLPIPFKKLMIEESSTVIEFYPTDFQVDYNGKKNAWEAVVLIPFIDEKKLLAAVRQINPADISVEELKRNKVGKERVFSADSYPKSRRTIAAVRPPVRNSNRLNSSSANMRRISSIRSKAKDEASRQEQLARELERKKKNVASGKDDTKPSRATKSLKNGKSRRRATSPKSGEDDKSGGESDGGRVSDVDSSEDAEDTT